MPAPDVSMKSGLEGRNNLLFLFWGESRSRVSMKSGLEGRNNAMASGTVTVGVNGLNEVRPRRPEQSS